MYMHITLCVMQCILYGYWVFLQKLLFCASYVRKPGAGWPQAAGMPGFSKLCLST